MFFFSLALGLQKGKILRNWRVIPVPNFLIKKRVKLKNLGKPKFSSYLIWREINKLIRNFEPLKGHLHSFS